MLADIRLLARTVGRAFNGLVRRCGVDGGVCKAEVGEHHIKEASFARATISALATNDIGGDSGHLPPEMFIIGELRFRYQPFGYTPVLTRRSILATRHAERREHKKTRKLSIESLPLDPQHSQSDTGKRD